MSYTLYFRATFRNLPGLTLNAALYDAANPTPNQVGDLITTGFSITGYGSYGSYATIPDDHVGSFDMWDVDNPLRRVSFAINPQEAEYNSSKPLTAYQTMMATEDGLSDYGAARTGDLSDFIGTGGINLTSIGDTRLAHLDANVSSRSTFSGGAVASVTGNVGGNVAGSVGSVTSGVTVTTNNDKTGYALSSAAIQAIWDALTSALTTVGSIGKLLVTNIDAAISSRLPASSYTAPTTPPTVTAIRQEMDTNSTKLANLDTTVSSRLATVGYSAPPSAVSIRSEIDSNSTKLDATVSSRASQSSLNALNNLSQAQAQSAASAALTAYGAATATNVSSAQTAITTAIGALNNLSATDAAAAIMAYAMMDARQFQDVVMDLWAVWVGNSEANDATSPTVVNYQNVVTGGQVTHLLTLTTRTLD